MARKSPFSKGKKAKPIIMSESPMIPTEDGNEEATLERQLAAMVEQRKVNADTARVQHLRRKLQDMPAVQALEEEHGTERVRVLEMPASPNPNVAALVLVRAPSGLEMKRYRDTLRDGRKNGKDLLTPATSTLGLACLEYPAESTTDRTATLAAFTALDTQAGSVAIELATGREESQGKG